MDMSLIERIKSLLNKQKKITPPTHDTSEVTLVDTEPVTPIKPSTPKEPPVKPKTETK